jgi:hypothetical protein
MVKSPGIIYRTTRDIVIPAGTEVDVSPPHRVDYFTETAVVLTAVTKDVTSTWHMDLEEALQEGLVKAAVKEPSNAIG